MSEIFCRVIGRPISTPPSTLRPVWAAHSATRDFLDRNSLVSAAIFVLTVVAIVLISWAGMTTSNFAVLPDQLATVRVTANAAFVELLQAASVDQLRGRHLSESIGRPGIDLDLIEGQFRAGGIDQIVIGEGGSVREGQRVAGRHGGGTG